MVLNNNFSSLGSGFGNNFQSSTGNTKISNKEKFKGLSNAQIKRLEEQTSSLTGATKDRHQQALYQQMITQIQKENYNGQRKGMENGIFYDSLSEKDNNKKNNLQSNVRLEQLADVVKDWRGLDASADTVGVIQGLAGYMENNGLDVELINKYLQKGDEELLYQLGIEERPDTSTRGYRSVLTSPDNMVGNQGSKSTLLDKGDRERNDDVLGHFDTKSYSEAGDGFWNKAGTRVGNAAKSTYNLGSDIVNMAANPVDTVNGLAKVAVGGAMNAFGSDDYIGDMKDGKLKNWLASANQVADGAGEYLIERYGGIDNIANSFYEDPAGVISDIAGLVSGGASLVKSGAKAAAKTTAKAGMKGATKTLENVATKAGKVGEVANAVDPATLVQKVPGKVYEGVKNLPETVGKVADGVENLTDKVAEPIANKITSTSSAQDKLYKAQEPRMNVLSNKKNLEQRRANSDRANQLILDNGYKPTNTTERLNAHNETMQKIWKQIESKVESASDIMSDQSSMIDRLSDYIESQKKLGIASTEGDIAKLEKELDNLKKQAQNGGVDIPTLEKKKQVYNHLVDRGDQTVTEVYKNGIKILTNEIGKIEDDLLSKVPGDFSLLKKDMGALLDTYEDVFKADMKNSRKKGLGVYETFSRIEGLGDVAKGILTIFNGGASDVLKGAGKVVLGKALQKATDLDYLVKEGFEGLSKGK